MVSNKKLVSNHNFSHIGHKYRRSARLIFRVEEFSAVNGIVLVHTDSNKTVFVYETAYSLKQPMHVIPITVNLNTADTCLVAVLLLSTCFIVTSPENTLRGSSLWRWSLFAICILLRKSIEIGIYIYETENNILRIAIYQFHKASQMSFW